MKETRQTALSPSRRQFPQARARATYQALLAAAQRVFADKGFDEAQSPDIAAAAGVSVGTFYRYFTDKRQAFVEMIGHHLAEAHADVMGRLDPSLFAGADRRDAIDAVLDVLFAHVRRFPELETVYRGMSLRDPEVAEMRAGFEALACDSLAKLIELVIPREVAPDARAAAFVIHCSSLEVAVAMAVRRAPLFAVDEAAVKAALAEMLERYLFPADFSRAPSRRPRGSGQGSAPAAQPARRKDGSSLRGASTSTNRSPPGRGSPPNRPRERSRMPR